MIYSSQVSVNAIGVFVYRHAPNTRMHPTGFASLRSARQRVMRTVRQPSCKIEYEFRNDK